MSRSRSPYIFDPIAQQSGTYKFVKEFITDYQVCMEKIHGAPQSSEPIYKQKAKDSIKSYIGRAAKVAGSKSPFESFSAFRIDLSQAIHFLTDEQRTALGYLSLGYTQKEIAEKFKITEYASKKLIDTGLTIITEVLDGTYGIT